jgi:hypothetical protein
MLFTSSRRDAAPGMRCYTLGGTPCKFLSYFSPVVETMILLRMRMSENI